MVQDWRAVVSGDEAAELCEMSDEAAQYPYELESNWVNLGLLEGNETYYFGVEWEIPYEVGNEIQSDSIEANVVFEIEQARHNNSPFMNN